MGYLNDDVFSLTSPITENFTRFTLKMWIFGEKNRFGREFDGEIPRVLTTLNCPFPCEAYHKKHASATTAAKGVTSNTEIL
jgi:hypothetical protein